MKMTRITSKQKFYQPVLSFQVATTSSNVLDRLLPGFQKEDDREQCSRPT